MLVIYRHVTVWEGMEQEQILNCWNFAKMIVALLAFVPNITLVVKIISRPNIQTLFNVSLASMFAIVAIFGPLLLFFYLEVFEHQFGITKTQDPKAICAYIMEFRNAIGESLRIIGVNFMFRFVFVVHADKGLSIRGVVNTNLLNMVYVAITFGNYTPVYMVITFGNFKLVYMAITFGNFTPVYMAITFGNYTQVYVAITFGSYKQVHLVTIHTSMWPLHFVTIHYST